ncbi:MAG: GxxExxY protein [Candidatus Omnitrophica bacterium]|nr:GxxExxY protein [Candidatus Omnitrophota bacterium]
MSKLLYESLSYEIRGACFSVWKQFRGAFKETIIQRALAKEFKDRSLKIEEQKRIGIFYKNEKVGIYVPDFVIDGKILLELKVKPKLFEEDKKQFWRYLKGSNYKIGLLVNFGSLELEIIRRVYDSARLSQRNSA